MHLQFTQNERKITRKLNISIEYVLGGGLGGYHAALCDVTKGDSLFHPLRPNSLFPFLTRRRYSCCY